MANFSLHIISSEYTGEYNSFSFEKNYIQKFFNKKKVLSGKNLLQIAEIIANDIRNFAKKQKWKNLVNVFLTRLIDENEAQVFVEKNAQKIVTFLHKGTRDHFIYPKKAKALHWIQGGEKKWGAQFGGEDCFSKGHRVSGIIAFNFFRVTRESRDKIHNFVIRKKNL